MCATENRQVCFLNNVFGVWKKHQQLLVVLTQKLVKADIVDATSVANWIFTPEMRPEITKYANATMETSVIPVYLRMYICFFLSDLTFGNFCMPLFG